MGVRKEAKDEIINLLLQNTPTEEIARKMNYSVGTVRKVFEELREEFGVNSTREIARIYLLEELNKLGNHISEIQKILDSRNFTTKPKSIPRMQKRGRKKKN